MAPRRNTRGTRKLPRAPLPRQTGGPHENKTKRPERKKKYRDKDVEE